MCEHKNRYISTKLTEQPGNLGATRHEQLVAVGLHGRRTQAGRGLQEVMSMAFIHKELPATRSEFGNAFRIAVNQRGNLLARELGSVVCLVPGNVSQPTTFKLEVR